jgi:hypothetical protein
VASETAIAPAKVDTLFEIEETYAAFLDTEALVRPEDEQAFRAELATSLKQAVEKRERFGQFILGCERRVAALKAEAKRLIDQADAYERAADRASQYGAWVIEQLGTDGKGKHRRLEGTTCVLSLRAGSARVEFSDEAVVPSEFKTLTITVPAVAWEQHIARYREMRGMLGDLLAAGPPPDQPSIVEAITRVDVHTSKTAVKKAIEGGREIPGADLKFGDSTLQVK